MFNWVVLGCKGKKHFMLIALSFVCRTLKVTITSTLNQSVYAFIEIQLALLSRYTFDKFLHSMGIKPIASTRVYCE